MKGGLVSIFIYGLICLWLCYCAKLIIKLFNKVPQDYRTYPGVSLKSFGMSGSFIISLVIVLENVGRTVISLITYDKKYVVYLFSN